MKLLISCAPVRIRFFHYQSHQLSNKQANLSKQQSTIFFIIFQIAFFLVQVIRQVFNHQTVLVRFLHQNQVQHQAKCLHLYQVLTLHLFRVQFLLLIQVLLQVRCQFMYQVLFRVLLLRLNQVFTLRLFQVRFLRLFQVQHQVTCHRLLEV